MIRDRLEMDGVACDIRLTNSKDSFEAALQAGAFRSHHLRLQPARLRRHHRAQTRAADTAGCPGDPHLGHRQRRRSGQVPAVWRDRLPAEGAARAARPGRAAGDRRSAESRLIRKRAEVALAQSERRKAAILDSVLDCIITIDADGVVIEFNTAAERTFGYTQGARPIGRPLADLIIPPRLAPRTTPTGWRAISRPAKGR